MADKTFTLKKAVAAIQVFCEANGRTRMGICTELPEGSRLEICGNGFSKRTVQVAADGAFYVVVLDRIMA